MDRSIFSTCVLLCSLSSVSTVSAHANPAPYGDGGLEVRQDFNAILSSAIDALNTLLGTPVSSPVATRTATRPTPTPTASPTYTEDPTSIDYAQILSQAGDIANSLFGGAIYGSTPSSTPIDKSSGSGMSNGTKIALGVAIPLGALLLAAVVFLYLKLKKHRYDRDLVYDGENAQVVHQLGGAGEAIEEQEEQLPSYSDLPENRAPATK